MRSGKSFDKENWIKGMMGLVSFPHFKSRLGMRLVEVLH